MATARDRRNEKGSEEQGQNLLQVVVTWISGILLLAVLGYLVWDGTRASSPAQFSTIIEPARSSGDHFYLPVSVDNIGGESVQGLGLTVELLEGESVLESSSVTLDWLPEGSTRRVVLVFERDPAGLRKRVRFGGYQVP